MNSAKILLVAVVLLSLSCSSSNDPLEIKRWELSSAFSYQTNSEIDVAELSYTETVEFVSDGLFLKARTEGGETTIYEGRWMEIEEQGKTGFRVLYLEDTPFVFNCFAEPEESYWLQNGLLIQNSGIPCDGPEYRYIPAID